MVESSGPARGRIRFEPALEGLRGFALIGMLCFHSQFAWAVGGFLPIATFFTLSGYLITSLFLIEYERTGGIRLGAFWARRFRRLMPASLLTLAGIALFGAWVATPDQLARLRDDVLWALLYGANWHFLVSDVSYRLLFEAPSPVQHFWSLAIEEQFYFVFPLIVVVGLRLGSGSRAVFGAVLATLAAASVLAAVGLTLAGAPIDRIYYGSDVRAAELLMGALLAVALCGRETSRRTVQRTLEGVGGIALLVMVGLWATVDLESSWLYLGGFAGYTLLSVAVIAAAVQPSGPVRALLSGRIMRWIGRVSYGGYLFHWPVYLWLSAERTGLGDGPLFVLRALVTFGLAGLSYELLESPIRSGRRLTGWRPFVVTPTAFAAVFLATSLVTAGLDHDKPDSASIGSRAELEEFVKRLQNQVPDLGEAPGLFQSVPRVAGFGDSTALPLGIALGFWLEKRGLGRARLGEAELGCGIARMGVYRRAGREQKRPNHCTDRDKTWPELIKQGRPDIAIVMVGPWDVCDRKLPGDDVWRHPGDPALDAYLRQEIFSAADLLLQDGTLVIWITHPSIQIREEGGQRPETPFPASDPARMARLNELIFDLERHRPGQVRVIDLAAYMRTLPGGEFDPTYRPDGTHLSIDGALKLVNEWFGSEVLRVYREQGSRERLD